jgi:hypothetical protein
MDAVSYTGTSRKLSTGITGSSITTPTISSASSLIYSIPSTYLYQWNINSLAYLQLGTTYLNPVQSDMNLGADNFRWDTVYGNTLNVTNITNPSAVAGYDVTLKLEGNTPNGCLITGELQTVPLQVYREDDTALNACFQLYSNYIAGTRALHMVIRNNGNLETKKNMYGALSDER